MPFQSEKQRRYLWANEPEIARDWTDTYGSKIHAADGGIMRLGFDNGGEVVDDMGHAYETSRYGNEYDPEYVTEEEFNEMFGEETSGIDTLKDKFTGGVDYMKKLPGMAIGALSKIPGAGLLMNAFQRPQYPSDTMSRSFAVENYGDPYNYNMGSGNLTGKDPFGINTISMMGNYPAYYDQYVRDYDAGKYSNTSKFAQEKYEHAQAVNKANQERIARDFTVTAEDHGEPPPTGGNQGNQQTGGGFGKNRDPGGGAAGSPFRHGGLTSLWPR
jgi:hypothetical protein